MNKRSFLSRLLLGLLAVTGLFLIMNGTACMLSQTFDASIHTGRAALIFGIAAVLFTVVSMIDRRKAAVIGHIAILCVLVLFVWIKYRALMNSAMYFADRVNQRYSAYTGSGLIAESLRKVNGHADMALIFGGILIGYLAEFMMLQLSWEILAYTPIYLAISGCLCCGRAPGKNTIIQLIAGMVILLLCKMFRRKSGYITSFQENLRDRVWNMLRRQYEHIRKRSKHSRSQEQKQSQTKRNWLQKHRRIKKRPKMVRIHWRKMMPHNIVPALVAACILLAVSMCVGGIVTHKIEKPVLKHSAALQRKEMKLEKQLIEKIQQAAQFVRNKGGIGGEGIMSNTAPHYTGKKIMTVTLDFKPDSDLYFRGFTGETYHNGVWSAGDDKEFKEQFEDVQTYLWGQNYGVLAVEASFSQRLQSAIQSGKITVEYNGMSPLAGKAFLPYFANLKIEDSNSSDTVVKLIGDGEIKRAKKSYTTDYYLMSQMEQQSYITSIDDPSLYEDNYDSDDTLEYSSIEQSIEKKYTEYASQHYGSYNAPELEKYKELVRKHFNGYYSADRAGDLLWAVNGVAELLAENTSYSLKLDSVPAGQDYAEYFLFGQKKGYCEHYATAATILLRDLGVPARYVSGYRLSKKSFHKGKDGKYTATVIDSDAHAWTETYGEHFGWMPWDMTPSTAGDGRDDQSAVATVTAAPAEAQSATPEPTETVAAVTPEPEAEPLETLEPTPVPTPKQKADVSGKKNAKDHHNGQKRSVHLTVPQIVLILLVLLVIFVILCFRLRQENRKHRIVTASRQKGKIAVGRSISYLMDALWLAGNAVPKGSGEQGLQKLLETNLQGAASAEQRQWYLETIWRSGYSPDDISPEEQQKFWKQTREYVQAIRNSVGKLRKVLFFLVFPR